MRRTVSNALAVGLAIAVCAPATPARAGDSGPGCLEADEAFAAGDDEGPPHFSNAFFNVRFALDASTDGFSKRSLAISIEAVCDVPAGYAPQAVQLSGSDGVAIITSRTRVFKGKRELKVARRRRAALDDADTTRLSVRLLPPAQWRAGEDERVPTFSTQRANITD